MGEGSTIPAMPRPLFCYFSRQAHASCQSPRMDAKFYYFFICTFAQEHLSWRIVIFSPIYLAVDHDVNVDSGGLDAFFRCG